MLLGTTICGWRDVEVSNSGSTANPPPLPSLNPHSLSLAHIPTLLLVSPVNLSSARISIIDDAGLLAVFKLLLITLKTYNYV